MWGYLHQWKYLPKLFSMMYKYINFAYILGNKNQCLNINIFIILFHFMLNWLCSTRESTYCQNKLQFLVSHTCSSQLFLKSFHKDTWWCINVHHEWFILQDMSHRPATVHPELSLMEPVAGHNLWPFNMVHDPIVTVTHDSNGTGPKEIPTRVKQGSHS